MEKFNFIKTENEITFIVDMTTTDLSLNIL